MSRDIVQFVPFRKFKGDLSEFAGQVLEEIPQQMCQYFSMKGIIPNERKIKGKEHLLKRN